MRGCCWAERSTASSQCIPLLCCLQCLASLCTIVKHWDTDCSCPSQVHWILTKGKTFLEDENFCSCSACPQPAWRRGAGSTVGGGGWEAVSAPSPSSSQGIWACRELMVKMSTVCRAPGARRTGGLREQMFRHSIRSVSSMIQLLLQMPIDSALCYRLCILARLLHVLLV